MLNMPVPVISCIISVLKLRMVRDKKLAFPFQVFQGFEDSNLHQFYGLFASSQMVPGAALHCSDQYGRSSSDRDGCSRRI